jgi:hypothetical protein
MMDKKMAVDFHLFEYPSVGEWRVASALVRALGNVREETGRDGNGNKVAGQDHGSWLGAIGYMAILDQIGKSFKPRNRVPLYNLNSIQKALRYFTRLGHHKINAIYALRCAFTHDYSLYNQSRKDLTLQHRFTVTQGTKPPLVKLPRVPWDGDILNRKHSNQTVVNLEKFGDLVEDIYRRLISLHNRKRLEISLKGGADELNQRYQIWTYRKR